MGTPFWPRFTVDVAVFEVKFDVTAFDVNIFVVYDPVFDISYFPLIFMSRFSSYCWYLEQIMSSKTSFLQRTVLRAIQIIRHTCLWPFWLPRCDIFGSGKRKILPCPARILAWKDQRVKTWKNHIFCQKWPVLIMILVLSSKNIKF